ncbi:unnamed protein product [Acanthoscelides obtectus]|uniref:Secreted protein n=1 Tax=Acanthoscelides obtectus TaxID=200917 RepID=A0A9P0L0U0_ACAOB|nr:unnamed protein product [Acanthoscelides obtectus]CAK1675015.1 hypothetical protein AOBTE_LOCUS29857 [Acanthoscelides obtectus]
MRFYGIIDLMICLIFVTCLLDSCHGRAWNNGDNGRIQDDHDRGNEEVDRNKRQQVAPVGVVGPVHTFVKTDRNANFKWGVRHVVGQRYAK